MLTLYYLMLILINLALVSYLVRWLINYAQYKAMEREFKRYRNEWMKLLNKL